MNDENEVKPEAQVVGEVVIPDMLEFQEPVKIAETPATPEQLRNIKLTRRLVVAERRLSRRQTTKIGRLSNLLNRVNGLRKQLGLNTLELKDRFTL